jgi:putative transposase
MPRWRLFYHVVWATDARRPLISPSIEPEVHQQLRDVARRHDIVVHAIGGLDDHIHMAISIPPKISVADAMRRLKGGSSHAIRAVIGPSFAWQDEYSIDSFSQRHLKSVVAYIDNQRQHHQDQTVILSIEPHSDPSEPG